MAAEKETLQAGVGELAATVRDLAASLGSIENRQEFLLAAQKLGAIAGAIIDFEQALPEGGPVIPALLLPENASEPPQSEAAVADSPPTAPAKPGPSGDVASTASHEPVELIAGESSALETRPQLSERKRNPTLTSRQQALLAILEDNIGKVFTPSELMKYIDAPTIAAKQAAFQDFVKKLQKMPEYATRLMKDGQTSSRYYWLRPVHQTAEVDESVEPEPADEAAISENRESAVLPATDSQSAPSLPVPPLADVQKRQLTDWGLAVSQNGHRRALVGDRPLSLGETSVEILEEIAVHEAGITFDTLRRLLSERHDRELSPQDLMRSLAQIKREIGGVTEHWSDEIKGINDENEEVDRVLRLGGLIAKQEAEVSGDFLAPATSEG